MANSYDDYGLLEGLDDQELEGYEGLGAGYDVRQDLGLVYRTTFGVERGRRVRRDTKGGAEKHLADTLRAVGHKHPDASAEAVSKAVGGNPAHIRAIAGAVRVTHKKRGKKKGDVDLHGIIHRRLHRHNPHAHTRFKGIHAKHKHDRETKRQRLIHALEKKGHKHSDAVKLAEVATHTVGGDLGATDALTNAILGSPSGTTFSLAQTLGTLSPALMALFLAYARQAGVSVAPPAVGGFRRWLPFHLGVPKPQGPTGDKLLPGAVLQPGQSMFSNQQSTRVDMGPVPSTNAWAGMVDLRDPTQNNKFIWHISEAHDGNAQGAYLMMQTDGQLVVKDSAGKIWWTSAQSSDTKSAPVPGAYFMVQNDGNLVVYDQQGNALWSPNTFNNFGRSPQPGPGPFSTAASVQAAAAASPGVGVATQPTGPLETLPPQMLSTQRPDVSADVQPGDTDTDTGDGGAGASAGFSAGVSAGGGVSASAGGGGDGGGGGGGDGGGGDGGGGDGGGAPSDGGGGGDGGGDGSGAPQYVAPTAPNGDGSAGAGGAATLNINVTSSDGSAAQSDGSSSGGDGGGGGGGDGSSPAAGEMSIIGWEEWSDYSGGDPNAAIHGAMSLVGGEGPGYDEFVAFGADSPFALKG